MTWTTALRGAGGNIELNRLVGFVGGLTYIAGAHAFIAYDMLANGRDFDIVAYCAAFPTGLAIVAGGTAAAVALKDRQVATAGVIERTGAVPAPPPEGPKAHLEPGR